MRRSAVLGAMLVVAMASPAGAKVMTEATITGPGLAAPLKVGPDHLDSMFGSGYMDRGKAPTLHRLGLSPSELGPRYRIVHRFDFDFDGTFGATDPVVWQDLYPYAEGGRPVTYMPRQEVRTGSGRVRFEGGWVLGSSSLRDFLVDRGLPESAPSPTEAVPTGGTSPPRRSWATWLTLGLAGLVAIAAAGLWRRRAAVTPTR